MTQNANKMTIDQQIFWLQERVMEMDKFYEQNPDQEFSDLHTYLSEILLTMMTVKKNLTSVGSESVIVSMPMQTFKRFMSDENKLLLSQPSGMEFNSDKL